MAEHLAWITQLLRGREGIDPGFQILDLHSPVARHLLASPVCVALMR